MAETYFDKVKRKRQEIQAEVKRKNPDAYTTPTKTSQVPVAVGSSEIGSMRQSTYDAMQKGGLDNLNMQDLTDTERKTIDNYVKIAIPNNTAGKTPVLKPRTFPELPSFSGDNIEKFDAHTSAKKAYHPTLKPGQIAVPVSNSKTIAINYTTAKAIDDFTKKYSNGNFTETEAEEIDNYIKGLDLDEEELKSAKSYAGLKKLALASYKDGKATAGERTVQPFLKFLEGGYGSAKEIRHLIFDGRDYIDALAEEEKYYRANPDELGNDMFHGHSILSPKGDFLENVNLEKMNEAFEDTSLIEQFISDAGFRTAGQMMATAGAAGMTGLPNIAPYVKGAASNVIAGTKAGDVINKIGQLAPNISKVAGKGVGAKALNKAIDKVNDVSLGKALEFLNPLDLENPTTAIMGLTAAEEKYKTLKSMGYDDETALKNALVTGYVNAITEKMGYDGANFDEAAGSLKQYLFSNASEGLEEVYANALERFGDKLSGVGYLDENGNLKKRSFFGNGGVIDPKATLESFAGGFVGGATMGAPAVISNSIANRQNRIVEYENLGKKIVEKDLLKPLIEEGLKEQKNSKIYKEAEKLQKAGSQATLRQVGKLYSDIMTDKTQKADVGSQVPNSNNITPQLTSETPLVSSSASKNNITQNENIVNNEYMQNRGNNTQSVKNNIPMSEPFNEEVRQFGETLGENGRRFLYGQYKGQVDFADFKNGFSLFYDAGMSGIPYNTATKYLTDETKKAFPDIYSEIAYEKGIQDAKAIDTELRANIPNNVYFGEDAELVKENLPENMDRKTANTIDEASKMLGIKTTSENDIVTDFDGEAAGGSYADGEVKFDKNDEDYISNIAHEIGHRMKETAPDEYRAVSNYAIRQRAGAGVNISEYIDNYIKEFKGTIDRDGAIEEITNNYIAKLVKDRATLETLIENAKQGKIDETKSVQENMNILQRFVEMLKEFVANIKAKLSKGEISAKAANENIKRAEEAMQLIQKAFNASVENASKYAGQNIDKKSGKVKYSIEKNTKGKYVQADEQVIKSANSDEWSDEIISYVNKKVRGGEDVYITLDNGEIISITERTAWKLGDRGKFNNEYYLVKGNASGVIDEIIAVSKHDDYKPPKKNHSNGFGRFGFEYRTAYFRDLDGRYYRLNISVGLNADGNEAYNIGKIKEITFPDKSVSGSKAQNEKLSHTDNISQKDKIVNTNSTQNYEKYSKKSLMEYEKELDEQKERNKELEKKNKELERKLAKAHKLITPDMKNIGKIAGEIIEDVESDIGKETLSSDLGELSKLVRDCIGGKAKYNDVKSAASRIARNILERSVHINTEMREQYEELINFLKETKIFVDAETIADFGGEYNTFRQKNFGRLGISTKEGTDIDEIYKELTFEYPEYFNEDAERDGKTRLLKIASVLDSLKPIYENPYEGRMGEAVDWLGNKMIDALYENSIKNDAYYNPNDEAGKMLNNILRTEAFHRNAEEMKLRIELSEAWRGKNEEQERRLTTKKIRKEFEKLQKGVNNPNPHKKLNVPELLDAPVKEFLSLFDLREDHLKEKTREKLEALRLGYEEYAKENKREENNDAINDNLSKASDVVIENIKKTEEIFSNTEINKISEMTKEELETLYKCVLSINKSLINHTYIRIKGKNVRIETIAEKILSQNKEKLHYESTKKFIADIKDTLDVSMLTPDTAAFVFGDTFYELYQEKLRYQQLKQAEIFNEYIKLGKRISKIYDRHKSTDQNKKIAVELSGGTVKLTESNIMNLYLYIRQPDALAHLAYGGFTVENAEFKRGEIGPDGTKSVFKRKLGLTPTQKFNAADVKVIKSLMTDEMLAVVKEFDKFLLYAAKLNNEVSLDRYGYKMFSEEPGGTYFPINVYKEYANTEPRDPRGMTKARKIENASYTKKRMEDKAAPLIVGDVFNEMTEYASWISKHAAYTVGIGDFVSVMNFKKTQKGIPKKGLVVDSLKGSFRQMYGNRMATYFDRFISDVHQNAGFNDPESSMIKTLASAYKGSVVGWSLSVAVQQPTAYIRAGAVLKTDNLIKGAASKKIDRELALKSSAALRFKDWGFYDVGLSPNIDELVYGNVKFKDAPIKRIKKEVKDSQMLLPAKLDEITWGKLFKACIYETMDTYKERYGKDYKDFVKNNKETLYKDAGKLFDNVVDRTQVVDTVFNKAEIMRNKNGIVNAATIFMSEPIQTYNTERRSVLEYEKEKRKDQKKALAKFTKTIGCIALSALSANLLRSLVKTIQQGIFEEEKEKGLIETITGFFKKIIGEEEKAEESAVEIGTDDEESIEKTFMQRWLTSAFKGFFSDITVGQIPLLRDISSMAQGYDVERIDASALSALVRSITRLDVKGYTTKNKVKQLAISTSELFGYSTGNLDKFVDKFLIRNILKATGSHKLEYEYYKDIYDINYKSSQKYFTNILYDAYKKGNEEDYNKILEDMIKNGVEYTDIKNKLKAKFLDDAKKGKEFESFATDFSHYKIRDVEEQKEEYDLDDLAKESMEDLKNYSSKYQEIQAELQGYIEKKKDLNPFQQTKAYDRIEKYAYEIAFRDATKNHSDPEKRHELSNDWIGEAEKIKDTLGISTGEYVYLIAKYGVSTSTMTSKGIGIVRKEGANIESYLKYKELTTKVEEELDKIRAQRPDEKLRSGEKKSAYMKLIESMDIPQKDKNAIKATY